MKRLTPLILIVILLAACQPTPPPALPTLTPLPPTQTPLPPPTNTPLPLPSATPVPPSPTATPGEVVLEIDGPGGSKSLTMAELMALPVHEGQAGTKSSTGRITPPTLYQGVKLVDLAGLVGGLDPTLGVNVVAKDGYVMTLSYDQIIKGDFITYDPATGDEIKVEEPLTVVVVFARGDQPLGTDEGPLRLAIASPKNNQVTDGHWSVKWVTKIELKPLGEEWSLGLNGVITDTLDRNTFQSCTAPGCHQATWTDDKAQTWVGVPLWLLAGRVDDQIRHNGPAFFDLLATLGYSVQVVASDGYSTTLEISQLAYNNNILLAYLVDDNPLPEKYFPLRLVGTDLDKGEMVGAVKQVNLLIDPAVASQAAALMPQATQTSEPTATPTAASVTLATPSVVELVVAGQVETELALNERILRSMNVAKITVEHPKKGKLDYEGVRLNDLLSLAKVKDGATKLVFTAEDGYSTEVELAQIQACADCLVAFTEEEGHFQIVLPGFETSFWVKDVVKIEVQ
jgi:DMSO/TMAO reductase YedYZ molybdopterin-dependent catalytic subunit